MYGYSLMHVQRLRLRACALLIVACALAAPSTYAGQRNFRNLSISGTPPTSVTAGQSYTFTPSVNAPRSRTLVYAIANQPAWASFSTATGQLSGTPGATSVGTYSNIVIAVSDGTNTATLNPFSVQVVAASTTLSAPAPAPILSGTPPTSVVAGSAYSFQPTASDPSGLTLSFSVQNLPAWAAFSIASGQIYGTPTSTQTGTYANIVISASDGTTASSMPAFSVTVTSPPAVTGTAVLSLTPPTQNTDGSALTNLAGMHIYYGNSASSMTQMIDVPGTAPTSYTLSNLASGSWYFAATAYTTDGLESSPSPTQSKTIS